MIIRVYVDAAYGVHIHDGKSHSGAYTVLGEIRKAEKNHEIQHRGRAGGVVGPCWQRNKLAQLLGRVRIRGGPSDYLPR